MSRRRRAPIPTTVFLVLALGVSTAHAQASHGWFGEANLGLLRQDAPSAGLTRSGGLAVLGRLGRDLGGRAALVGELGWLSTTRNTDVSFLECETSAGCFGGSYLGPTAILTFGAGLRLMTRPSTIQAYATAGPMLFWAAHREAGTRPLGLGGMAGGGLIFQAGPRTAVVGEATYRRLATTGSTPRRLVPITLGLELR